MRGPQNRSESSAFSWHTDSRRPHEFSPEAELFEADPSKREIERALWALGPRPPPPLVDPLQNRPGAGPPACTQTTSTIMSPHIPVTKKSIARLQKSDMTEHVMDMTMRRRGAMNSSTRTTLKLRANLSARRERRNDTLPAVFPPSTEALANTSIKDWATRKRSKTFQALSRLQKKYCLGCGRGAQLQGISRPCPSRARRPGT